MNVKIKNLGITKYQDTWLAMKNFISCNPDHDEIWITEHFPIYTIGLNKKGLVLPKNKDIELLYVDRGGKITYHGPGQLIFYFVIDLKKRKKDIRKFITLIENSIIDTLKCYKIETFSDKKNIGIWYNDKSNIKKVAAIGVRVSKWFAYHGFSININNNLDKYNSIIPCGIRDKGVTTLKKIIDQDYSNLDNIIIEKFISNLKN